MGLIALKSLEGRLGPVAVLGPLIGPVAVGVLLVGLVVGGCKGHSPVKQDSPEAVLESFFKALKEKRIPAEIETFVIDGAEQARWRVRCEHRGCSKGTYSIRSVEERGDNGATLLVDYEVYGKKDQRVMRGKNSPLLFEKQAGKWGIVQFGRQLAAPEPPKAPAPAPPDDDKAGAQ